MRYIRCVFTMLLLLVLLINGEIEVLAMNTGFSTEQLAKDDIDTLLKNIDLSLLSNEPPQKAIECFDVNEDGMIAIGCNDFENKTVCIYTHNGDFQYGYRFKCNGSFGVEFDKSALNIYIVRSDVAIAVNSVGEVEDVLKIQNTSENNTYWNNCIFSTERKIGDVEYTIENNMSIFNVFASSYSQLIFTNENGEKSIIYDVNSTHFLKILVIFIGVLVVVGIIVIVLIGQYVKRKRDAWR